MTISQQRLHKLEITKLKNVKDLCISFESKNLTGILGPNGYGKSTILHALACCFQPPNERQEDYKFSNFFLPSSDALWEGSELKIVHTYRQSSQLHENVEQAYGKSSDRWKPIYKRRPTRNVHYFGVDSCVPLIEAEKRNVKINYSTSNVSEDIITTILEKASHCLNRQYTAYNIHDPGKGRKFIGVEADGIRYSALSMSAGEQKIFLLLEKIFKASKYSLFLIDELDLLLHDSAMKHLIKVVSERAQSHNLQVVFTTHRESILELSDLINVRHIFGTSEKTLCFNETKPDAINRLTGTQPKLIEVFVEDDLAKAIIKKVAGQLGISRHVSVQRFGAAINCFTVLAGLRLRGESCKNSIFVLDGDVYRTEEDHKKRLKAVLTGNDEHVKSLLESSLEKVKCLNLPENTKPEQYIHSILIGLERTDNDERNEIIEVAKQIVFVDDSHKYVDDIISILDWNRDTGLSKIIDIVSSTQEWNSYIANVKDWLVLQIPLVNETASQDV
ncbi:AAA family ATPase [Microcoleus sp. A2-C5]|uniref:ATP-dependent nuclease n=1 Tax=unclassified Microcoleus TaxID=2642155 RepID=UPI002FD35113